MQIRVNFTKSEESGSDWLAARHTTEYEGENCGRTAGRSQLPLALVEERAV